jgi:hypothetical protein
LAVKAFEKVNGIATWPNNSQDVTLGTAFKSKYPNSLNGILSRGDEAQAPHYQVMFSGQQDFAERRAGC